MQHLLLLHQRKGEEELELAVLRTIVLLAKSVQ
jgi:hypothetical protein